MAALRLSHSGSLVPGLPPGKARRIGQSAVELVLDRLCGGEGQLLRRGDLNCRASGRIAAFASGAFLYLELAKAIERDFVALRSEEHTSELQSLMRISYAVFCLKKKKV